MNKKIIIEERDKIPLKLEVGKLYGLSWANPDAVWVYKGMGCKGDVEMMTPKTKKILFAKASEVRHTKQDALIKAKKRLNLL